MSDAQDPQDTNIIFADRGKPGIVMVGAQGHEA